MCLAIRTRIFDEPPNKHNEMTKQTRRNFEPKNAISNETSENHCRGRDTEIMEVPKCGSAHGDRERNISLITLQIRNYD